MGRLINIRKTVHSLIVVFLLSGYCYVAYLAYHPNVTPEYRAYYIDRTTTLSPIELKQPAPYKAGTAVNHKGTSSLLFDGWSQPEEKHRWSLGKKSRLWFYIEDPESFTGKIRLDCFYFQSQQITVDVNRKVVDSFTGIGKDAFKTILFDPTILKENSLNSIGFSFPDAQSPGHKDRRQLALALKEITIF